MKRLVADVPPELHRAAKIRAAETGQTLTALIVRSLERHLARSISHPAQTGRTNRKAVA